MSPAIEPAFPRPRALTLELTKGCNLRCGYCYYAEREHAYDPKDRMSREVAEQSVDLLLRDGPEEGPLHLHFFGGEPLLDFPLLCHTVLYAEEKSRLAGRSFTFEVTTNGTRFTDEVIAFLDDHAIRVGVSFDGPPEVQDVARPLHGGSSHLLAEPGIRKLLDGRRGTPLEKWTHCSVVVTRRELDLVKIVRHLEEMGFRKILLTPATDLTGKTHGVRPEDVPRLLASYSALARDYEKSLLEERPFAATVFPSFMNRLLSGQKKLKYCDGGRDYLGVAASGDLHLCYRFYENDEFSMGSVQEGVDRGVTRKLMDLPVERKTDCSVCWARYYCGGGCHHDNLIAGGGLGSPNPVSCDILRHNMSLTLGIWARLSRTGKLPHIQRRQAGKRSTPLEEHVVFADSDRPRKNPRCHEEDLGGERAVYEPESHDVAVLNGTASVILDLCDGERSVADVLSCLCERYPVEESVLRKDLLETLDHLRSRSLIS